MITSALSGYPCDMKTHSIILQDNDNLSLVSLSM